MKKLLLILSVLFVVSCTKDPVIYILSTNANPFEGGTVSPSIGQYEAGETVLITATPSAEYVLENWLNADGSSNTTSVVMDSDKTVTANFVKKKYALNVDIEGEGTVTEKVIKAGVSTDYNSGTIVELTAMPSSEWLFVEWTGDLTGTENPAQITIDKAKTVKAVFIKKQYALTVEVEGEGTVTEKVIKVGTATDYNSGTIVELTAEPTGDWEFVEWSGDIVSAENPVEITIDEAKNVKAVFELIPFYLDDNGLTIKAKSWVQSGTEGLISGVSYTAVDNNLLKTKAVNGDDMTKLVTSLVTDMSSLFANATTFNQDISSWDTSNVTDMSYMFQGKGEDIYDAKNMIFNQDISSWDVSSVTDMSFMFHNTISFDRDSSEFNTDGGSFNQDLSSWDVSNVTNMSHMFTRSSFDQDISGWDVSNVTNMSAMFSHINIFNQDLSSWDVSNVNDMSAMFSFTSFNQDITSWNVSNVTNMSSVFQGTPFNQEISSWDVSNATNMSNMFMGTSFNQDISSWDVSGVINFSGIFSGNTSFNQDISSWNVSNATNMSNMFMGTSFNQGISSWNVSNVNNMSGMFQGASFNNEIGNWNVSNVLDMSSMFSSSSFDKDISNWDVGSVTSFFNMFSYNTEFNQNIGNWNVSSAINMTKMFSMSSFNQDIGRWNVSSVTEMYAMFWGASDFNQFIGKWNVSNVLNMHWMFNEATSFNQDLTEWCVTNVNINFWLGKTEPDDFSKNSPLLETNKPVWGTCPD